MGTSELLNKAYISLLLLKLLYCLLHATLWTHVACVTQPSGVNLEIKMIILVFNSSLCKNYSLFVMPSQEREKNMDINFRVDALIS